MQKKDNLQSANLLRGIYAVAPISSEFSSSVLGHIANSLILFQTWNPADCRANFSETRATGGIQVGDEEAGELLNKEPGARAHL